MATRRPYFTSPVYTYVCTYTLIQKVLFLGQTFEKEILMDLHVLKSFEFKNHILVICLCVCVHYQHNSETDNNRNFKFSFLHFYHVYMLLENYENQRKCLCTEAQKRIVTGYGWNFLLVHFRILDCTKYNKNDIHFCFA